MNDSELKDILLSIQGNIIGLHNEITETRNSLHGEIVETKNSLHNEIEETRNSLHGEIEEVRNSLHNEIEEVKGTVKKLEQTTQRLERNVNSIQLTLENEINRKISALFDGRIDEMRHRKENTETIERVANLEMRVDNLEKAFKVS